MLQVRPICFYLKQYWMSFHEAAIPVGNYLPLQLPSTLVSVLFPCVLCSTRRHLLCLNSLPFKANLWSSLFPPTFPDMPITYDFSRESPWNCACFYLKFIFCCPSPELFGGIQHFLTSQRKVQSLPSGSSLVPTPYYTIVSMRAATCFTGLIAHGV